MAGVKSLVTGKSGGSTKLKKFRPTGFTSGGLSGTFERGPNGKFNTGQFVLSRSAGMDEAISGVQGSLLDRAAEFRGLRGSQAFSDLIRGRVDAIRAAGSRTVGNLREQLSRRRVAGSSFAEREIAATEAMFGREEERATAEGRIMQLGFEAEVIDRETQAAVQAAGVALNQLNLESGLAAQLGQAASQQMLARASGRAQLADAAAQYSGDFFSALVGYAVGGGYS